MKTTLIIDDDLMAQTMKIYNVSTKTQAVERALQEAVASDKRKKLIKLFGSRKKIQTVPRK